MQPVRKTVQVIWTNPRADLRYYYSISNFYSGTRLHLISCKMLDLRAWDSAGLWCHIFLTYEKPNGSTGCWNIYITLKNGNPIQITTRTNGLKFNAFWERNFHAFIYCLIVFLFCKFFTMTVFKFSWMSIGISNICCFLVWIDTIPSYPYATWVSLWDNVARQENIQLQQLDLYLYSLAPLASWGYWPA